ncbi:MAG: TlpA disulfide reductase family protein [Bacteroidales bacterium]|nr:AhpC/TSA family protein [Bacteroidales bacterium]MDD2424426.1 TlpA disulfide reductase family protein [Bacteroidales bacterium]MDD3989008.1 TlpA disulfide reductase family protein [Bacteroidales bacterium]MDD4638799.1 TlpA disulfide reductase family protein [Bacteroidales bacterium]
MKRSFLIAAMAFFCIASFAQSKDYTVTGTAPQEISNGSYAYLYDMVARKNIDSAIIRNGKFEFKGKAEGSSVYSVTVGRKGRPFILEGGTIYIDFLNQKIGGSPLNDVLAKYENETGEIYKAGRAEQQRMGSDRSVSETDRRKMMEELMGKMNDKLTEIALSYLKINNNNAAGALIFNNNIRSLIRDNKELFDKFYSCAGEYVKKYPSVIATVKKFGALDKTRVGMHFKDFTIANGNPDGSKVSLSDYVGKGKYILVDFWASWCAPCKAEIPNIAAVYNEFKGDKFDVLSIAVWDEREKTIKSAKEHNVIWNQIIDAQRIPTDLYGISSIPQIMLFGPDGKIVAKKLRGENIRKTVAEALGR